MEECCFWLKGTSLQGRFLRFSNCTNSTKSRKASQIHSATVAMVAISLGNTGNIEKNYLPRNILHHLCYYVKRIINVLKCQCEIIFSAESPDIAAKSDLSLKTQPQISKTRCFVKYCSCDKASQFLRAYFDRVIWKN